jgi:ribonuclease R
MIKPNDFGQAFHGDTVKVEVSKNADKGRRVEGKVVEVVERKQSSFVGNIQLNKNVAFFIPGGEKAHS